MSNGLINKLLNGQTTLEEEHLIARMLQQEEDMEAWLTDDQTAEYDRIVSLSCVKRRVLRWAVAAIAVVLVATGVIVFWPREQVRDTIAEQKPKEVIEPVIRNAEPPAVTVPVKTVASYKRTPKRVKQQTAGSPIDSLQYYITRLEKELESVNESTYTVKVEEVLHADFRLQRLVQRIMIGELTKDNMPAEAMNTNQTMEERP